MTYIADGPDESEYIQLESSPVSFLKSKESILDDGSGSASVNGENISQVLGNEVS